MFRYVKIHDSRVRGLVGSTNREERGVSEADSTYVDSSAVGVHSVNSDAICTYSHVVYVMACMCLPDNICSEHARQSLQHI